MNKLPQNFEMDKYDLHVRLVNEDDAEFIIKLRTNPKLAKFIHDTDSNVESQKLWISKYKEREAIGFEYYFIYSIDNIPFAVNRLYNIHDDIFTGGSWICLPNRDVKDVVATVLLQCYIAFDMLNMRMNDCYDGIHEENKKVLKFNKMIGLNVSGTIQDVKGKFYVGTMIKDDFEKCRNRLEKLLNLR